MAKRIITLILLCITSVLLCTTPAWAAGLISTGLPTSGVASVGKVSGPSQFLPADQAFSFDYQQHGNTVELYWHISPGYYLYRQQLAVNATQATLAPFTLPAGLPHNDEFFGHSEIYRDELLLPVTLNNAQAGAVLSVSYQGCAASGFCYPPQTQQITLHPVSPAANSNTTTAHTEPPAATARLDQPPVTASPTAQREQLPFNPLWALLIGIGIAFTPCVLPMYPLISAIVLGGQQRLSAVRALWLGLVYIQGMALTYTALGIVVALAGLQFQAAFQSPWILVGLSVIFVLLALSMFGLFTLQLPSALQTRLTLLSNRQQGGSGWGVFIMGAIGGLICSPCTTAPLSAILLYIAQSGNLWQGGGTLYLYALGMGLPLLLVTLFGNRLLPKSGPWMQQVKIGFGFIILALPVFLLERVIGDPIGQLLWAVLGIAFFGWAFIISLRASQSWMRVVQIFCLAAALVAARPLQDWLFASPANTTSTAHLAFTQIHDREQLHQALAAAKGKTVMLDLYADWCVACKEFEKYTFRDTAVQQTLANTVLLQINMTRNSPENSALLKQLNVLGLPTILFFSPQGEELPQQRVTGFMDAPAFLSHLQNTLAAS